MPWSRSLTAALAAATIPAAAHAAAPTPVPTAKPMAFQDLAGQRVSLAEVVGDRPTLLVFLRHFG